MIDSDYERDRADMVARQIEGRGVRDPRVLDAMRRIPRHEFVPEIERAHAYEDRPLPIGYGQTISQPYMVGVMTEALKLTPGDRVLEVGTGSGYQAAILSLLVAKVISIERISELAAGADAKLRSLEINNVTVLNGDGTLGCPEKAPFDAIIVTAGGPEAPEALRRQLCIGGRLLCPVGPRDGQRLSLITRTPEGYAEEPGVGCVFVPLIGSEGWPN
ncbi:MAG: protein-L-isoaspartate(D-aspartate) O-methyltransferase [Candidatus Hydrogenedentes bacterium]|nr:protein-L-isoaspartate(D-aspartate) O-methyltransferase [Candidatus Hydrogenedentota bacterium]